MGGKKKKKTKVKYVPAPPPPKPTPVPTQSLSTQIALNEASAKQTRLNMELGAQLDRTNAEFFAGQDIRRIQATGAETRLTQKQAGDIETGLTRVRGQETRATIGETGRQERLTTETRGVQERLTTQTRGQEERATQQTIGQEQRATVRTTGEEQRKTVGKTAEETRATALQAEMFRRYKENRDYEQAQSQYRT